MGSSRHGPGFVLTSGRLDQPHRASGQQPRPERALDPLTLQPIPDPPQPPGPHRALTCAATSPSAASSATAPAPVCTTAGRPGC
ncbi:hypothetical protein ACFPM0_37075 [Pseudonocardia sulfidoxydans]|uniref:hypothetical protein n=1 Tax=Pseudonocardia sulfidoxydans TaxID=54011 RepID=UPI00360CEB95